MASNNELLAFSSPLQEELANKENAQLPVVPLFSDFLKIKKLYDLEPYEIRYNRVAGSNGYP